MSIFLLKIMERKLITPIERGLILKIADYYAPCFKILFLLFWENDSEELLRACLRNGFKGQKLIDAMRDTFKSDISLFIAYLRS